MRAFLFFVALSKVNLLKCLHQIYTTVITVVSQGSKTQNIRGCELNMNAQKYSPFPKVVLKNRMWPNNCIEKAPVFCSVDLRDGNQALINPMSVEQKIQYFHMLVDIGFKEIEVAFPAASETDFLFVRKLIEENHIPDDVTIQVLVQAREHLIDRTFEAIQGVQNVIVHVYNSTSTLQRDVVFNMSKEEVKEIACRGVAMVKERAQSLENTHIRLEYSPESFMGTELPYAVEIIDAVCEIWDVEHNKGTIINLPLTLEEMMPNIYADQIEYMCTHMKYRAHVSVSVHTHNDRGSGNAATELALLAGADRVEGTLFGNGERTGNADLVILGLNLFTEGIDPGIDLSNIDSLIECYTSCTNLPISPRHPYVGSLVYTAFSGSHQDAIKKGLERFNKGEKQTWNVPYLTIDPHDVGRSYDDLIRINSQSGKSGIAYVLETHYGFELPKKMQIELSSYVQKATDMYGRELNKEEIYTMFNETYITNKTIHLKGYDIYKENENVCIKAELEKGTKQYIIDGSGNGPLAAYISALNGAFHTTYEIRNYYEHAISDGSDACAVSYVNVVQNGKEHFGAGISSNTTTAAMEAILSAIEYIK